MWNKKDINYKLYLVTDRRFIGARDLGECVKEAILGGATMVQLREKNVSSREFYQIARELKKITTQGHVPLFINDRLDIAQAVDADGLHIGQSDLPADVARKILGPDKIIGVSASTLEEARLAEQQGADYLGVGSVFATSTKKDATTVSLTMLEKIKQSVSIPVVAIGGISSGNVQKLMPAGIDGVAVISAILGSPDIKKASENLCRLMEG